MKKLFDLWDESIDYPQDVADNGVPQNTLYCYISSTFLDGFINYVKPFYSCVVERYKDWNEFNMDESIAKFNNSAHSKLYILQDDVLILAESKESYWFFWYDRDSSDCCIGRTEKTISKEDMINLLKVEIGYHHFLHRNFKEIELKGWIGS